jgi:hypothetical protein
MRSRLIFDQDGHLIILADTQRATVARGFWSIGMGHVQQSLQCAERLAEAGFASPALVWAVRSVEIFFRQCVMVCVYYDEGADIESAIRRAEEFVGSGNWSKVWPMVEALLPKDEVPVTDRDEHAWDHWKRVAVGTRDKVVHGLEEVAPETGTWAAQYARRVVSWTTQRLAISDRGPLRGLLRDVVSSISELAEAERGPQADSPEMT